MELNDIRTEEALQEDHQKDHQTGEKVEDKAEMDKLAEELGMSYAGYAQVAPGMYVRNEDMGAFHRHRKDDE